MSKSENQIRKDNGKKEDLSSSFKYLGSRIGKEFYWPSYLCK